MIAEILKTAANFDITEYAHEAWKRDKNVDLGKANKRRGRAIKLERDSERDLKAAERYYNEWNCACKKK